MSILLTDEGSDHQISSFQGRHSGWAFARGQQNYSDTGKWAEKKGDSRCWKELQAEICGNEGVTKVHTEKI